MNALKVLLATERVYNDHVAAVVSRIELSSLPAFAPLPITEAEHYILGQLRAALEEAKANYRRELDNLRKSAILTP